MQIAGLTGLATAVNAHMTGWAASRGKAASPKPSAIPAAAAPDTSRASAPAPPSEDALALAAIVQRRYGKHLAEKQLEAVTREIESRLQSGKRLREAVLANADEPDFVFRAE